LKNIYIRAFRAVDDKEASQKFVDGHKRVLENVGITEVTSSNNDWIHNPAVYVILIESGDRSKVYGGARVHVADGITQLPVEEATMEIDPKILEVVSKQVPKGTGEICGLWNSLEVAGYGIGSTYAIRSAICILPMMGLDTCFALCSPYTARVAKNFGFLIDRTLGNNGTFYYPKLDLLATVVFVENSLTLESADPEEIIIINELRKTPNTERIELGKKGEVQVIYDLQVDAHQPINS